MTLAGDVLPDGKTGVFRFSQDHRPDCETNLRLCQLPVKVILGVAKKDYLWYKEREVTTMDYKEQKRKYPILAVRMTPEEMAYLRRESEERKIKLSKYVKAILIPFNLSTVK